MPDPWDEAKVNRLFNGEEKLTPLSERLRRSFALSAHLQKLEQQSIGVFVGTYTARAQRPRYNADEGSLSISTNQRFEPVTVCKVRLASSLADKVVILVDD